MPTSSLPLSCPMHAEAASPKRDAILAAATQLFLAGGYANVSMDSVAKEAGVSKATLYAYFTGKEALFGAMVGERCKAIAQDAATMAATAGEEPGSTLRAMGRLWMRFMLDPQTLAIHRTVLAEAPRFPDLAEGFYASGPAVGRAWLAHLLAAEQAKGRLRADADPLIAADHLIGMLRGDLHFRATLGGVTPDEAAMDAVVDAALDTFHRAFGVSPP